ncbi:PilW family protein [Hydrogenophaga sp.]|uniref:PilW family protein n=1 Tax=Hydrogenophaga sp. TaxID=1904254 RepID=UPI00272459DF|nr:PilW family protein [Hydrogenophaga sp.]MDO8906342.1 PilW family protein [Hydrogenophaga sp.]
MMNSAAMSRDVQTHLQRPAVQPLVLGRRVDLQAAGVASAARRARQHGLSLVELLVAMAIGLALLSALVTIYVNGSRSNLEQERSVRQLDNGRYAMEVIGEDISMAGYYGDVVVEDLTFGPVDACANTLGTLGWNAATATGPVAITGLAADEAAAAACLDNHLAGTPALLIRRVDTARLQPAAAMAGTPYLQTSRCVSDPVATKFVLAAATADFTLRTLDCATANTVQRYITRIYYVARCNECGIDTVPTLKVAELRGAAFASVPLAEGVEDIAFEFGFDTDANGSADVYQTGLSGVAGADNDWSNVVAARVYLLTRTTEATPGFTSDRTFNLGLAGARGPFADTFKRRVYVMTNRLNNVAGPRETP